MSGQYQDYSEIMTGPEVAEMFRVSPTTVRDWFRVGETPFGKVILGTHFFKSGREIRVIKDRICQLAGILPKSKEFNNAT